MEVEGFEDHPTASVSESEVSAEGCESKTTTNSVSTPSTSAVVPQTTTLAYDVPNPSPRSISEVEMGVLQVL